LKTVKTAAFAIAFVLLACAALSQDNTEDIVARFNREIGKRKRNVASPSYGLMLFHGRVRPVQTDRFTSPMTDEGILLQGIDMRFFIGKNVTTRGGFYSGIESGIFAYFSGLLPGASSFSDSATVDDNPYGIWPVVYEARVKVDGAFVFLMGKYGLRIDTGSPLYGLSFGVEMGVGGGIRSGGVELFVGKDKNPIAQSDLKGGSEVALVADTALEASLRMGRNFRLFGKLGLIILPLKYSAWDPMSVDQRVVSDPGPNSNDDYTRYALQHYVFEMDTFAYELRVGFALSFN
jgi:hypothetical protein